MQTLLVGARRLYVAEGVDDFGGRIDLLQLHLIDEDTGPVCVQRRLHQLAHLLFGLLPILRQDRLNFRFPDDLAHGALGHVLHSGVGVLNVEKILLRVLDAPEHDEVDIDDVLVASQHQAFCALVADASSRASTRRRPKADLDGVLDRHLRHAHLFNRIGPP